MSRKIKLIWDFRGPAAAKTAEHHEKHLKEYVAIEQVLADSTGHQNITDVHSIAYLVVAEKDMIAFRDALKPHRGEVWTATDPS